MMRRKPTSNPGREARETLFIAEQDVRTKATNGANLKKFRGDGVVRSCSGTLKGMVLSLDGSFVGSTFGANETQHRNRVDLEVAQSLNQAFGRSIDFQHSLYDFFGVLSNDEGVHLGQSWFQPVWRVEQFASHGTSQFSEIHVCRESRPSVPY